MSRVDDDRQAQRAAERLMLEKRQQEQRTRERAGAESAFAKLVSQGQVQKDAQQTVRTGAQQASSEVDAQLGETVAEAQASVENADARRTGDTRLHRQRTNAFGERLKQAHAGEGERASEGRLSDAGQQSLTTEGRTQDARTGESRAESRREDAHRGEGGLKERGESAQKGGTAFATGRGEPKTDRDGGGRQNPGGGRDGQSGGDLPQGFRFNPALMAPVPVAKPKESSASERLRALANEIAQKIVQSVRVGTNAAGVAEFQIDLRSTVLSGLSIKVSGGNGRIRATFAGSDREVLKLLEDNKDALKQALGGRGLSLEELRIEVRA